MSDPPDRNIDQPQPGGLGREQMARRPRGSAGREPPPMPDPAGAIAGALARPMGLPALSLFVEPGDRVVVVVDAEAEAAWELVLPGVVGILGEAGASSIRLHLAGELRCEDARQGWERLVPRLAARFGGAQLPVPADGAPLPVPAEGAQEASMQAGLPWQSVRSFQACPPAAPGASVAVGKVPGLGTVRLDSHIATADKLVLVGALTPHPLAGFSSGGLLLAHGCSDEATKEALLSLARIGTTSTPQQPQSGYPEEGDLSDANVASARSHPLARSGMVEGNPIQAAAVSILDLVAPAFLVELAFQRGQRPAGVFAGGVREAHRAAIAFHRRWHGGPEET